MNSRLVFCETAIGAVSYAVLFAAMDADEGGRKRCATSCRTQQVSMILALSYRNPLDTRTGTTNSGNAARRFFSPPTGAVRCVKHNSPATFRLGRRPSIANKEHVVFVASCWRQSTTSLHSDPAARRVIVFKRCSINSGTNEARLGSALAAVGAVDDSRPALHRTRFGAVLLFFGLTAPVPADCAAKF
jgi:hypothetical protein